jgi:histidinol-phosphate aminotransferase
MSPKDVGEIVGLVRPSVRAATAYTLEAPEAEHKLNQNENPYDLPLEAKRRVAERALARSWSRYPQADPAELIGRIAALCRWPAAGVLVSNGSNQLIQTLMLCFVVPGTRVVIAEPSFALFGASVRLLGGETIGVPLTPELEFDVAGLEAALRESRAPLAVLCSPNNPTGCALAVEDAARLCRASAGVVVLDEAYHEFVGESFVSLLDQHVNLVVMRTFSKALGLAGLRLGYLLAHPALVAEVRKARLPFDVDFFAEAAALAALDCWPMLEANVRRLSAARDALHARLGRLPGIRVFPSRANFLLVRLDSVDHRAVFEALLRRGVLVRDVSAHPRLARCLRLSVGTDAENAALVSAFEAALAELAG